MALSLNQFVMGDPDVAKHVKLSFDVVGSIAANAPSVAHCRTSSGWSECVVSAYHLCGQDVAASTEQWWNYTVCMFEHQYPLPSSPDSRNYLECAGFNPVHLNQTCSWAAFPGIVSNISGICAVGAGLNAAQVEACATGSDGLALLKASMDRSFGFPKSLLRAVEPQWVLVDGPTNCSEESGGWAACEGAFDKTDCEDWDHCSSDAWAQHLRQRVCKKAGILCNYSI